MIWMQRVVNQWLDRVGPNKHTLQTDDLKFHALRVLHEATELCIASGASRASAFDVINDEYSKAEGRDPALSDPRWGHWVPEIGDVLGCLLILCSNYNIDIEDAFTRKFLGKVIYYDLVVDEHGVLWRRRTEK